MITAKATRIMRTMGFIPAPCCVTGCESDEEEAAAAGLSTMQSEPHWETGVAFSDPASHSSFPSRIPLPQDGADETDSDDGKEDDSTDEETSDDAEDSLLSGFDADETSDEEELTTDAREKKRMEESWDDEDDILKLQSGRRNGSLERTDDNENEEDADAVTMFALDDCREVGDGIAGADEAAAGRNG